MGSEPLVSIVVPTYNRVAYLRQAVQSVFAQTYREWELIVVDDGSTDETARFLAGVSDGRVRAVRTAHRANPAALRNLGWRQARGEYVAFLDSDDLWRSNKLALQVADLAAHPECGWSYTFCDRIGAAGEPLPFPAERRCRPYRGWIAARVVTLEAVIVTPSVIVRRALLERLGGFDETFLFFEDYELWTRCALASPATVVPQELTLVREHPGNNTKGHLETHDYWLRLVRQTAAGAADPHLKAVCRRESGRILVRLAAQWRWRGRYGPAWHALGRALAYGAPRAWWGAALKTLLRPVVPAWMRRLTGRPVPGGRAAA